MCFQFLFHWFSLIILQILPLSTKWRRVARAKKKKYWWKCWQNGSGGKRSRGKCGSRTLCRQTWIFSCLTKFLNLAVSCKLSSSARVFLLLCLRCTHWQMTLTATLKLLTPTLELVTPMLNPSPSLVMMTPRLEPSPTPNRPAQIQMLLTAMPTQRLLNVINWRQRFTILQFPLWNSWDLHCLTSVIVTSPSCHALWKWAAWVLKLWQKSWRFAKQTVSSSMMGPYEWMLQPAEFLPEPLSSFKGPPAFPATCKLWYLHDALCVCVRARLFVGDLDSILWYQNIICLSDI